MHDPSDAQRERLVVAIANLNELDRLLRWLEPSLRGEMTNDWHVVSACGWIANNRRRDVEKQLRELDEFDHRVERLDG